MTKKHYIIPSTEILTIHVECLLQGSNQDFLPIYKEEDDPVEDPEEVYSRRRSVWDNDEEE